MDEQPTNEAQVISVDDIPNYPRKRKIFVRIIFFILSLGIPYGADVIINLALTKLIEWMAALTTFIWILLFFFGGSAVLIAIAYLYGVIVNFSIFYSPLRKVSSWLIGIYIVSTSLLAVIILFENTDWEATKSVIFFLLMLGFSYYRAMLTIGAASLAIGGQRFGDS